METLHLRPARASGLPDKRKRAQRFATGSRRSVIPRLPGLACRPRECGSALAVHERRIFCAKTPPPGSPSSSPRNASRRNSSARTPRPTQPTPRKLATRPPGSRAAAPGTSRPRCARQNPARPKILLPPATPATKRPIAQMKPATGRQRRRRTPVSQQRRQQNNRQTDIHPTTRKAHRSRHRSPPTRAATEAATNH